MSVASLARPLAARTSAPMVAAVYLRISDDREGRELGVQRQREQCLALAARLGVSVYRIYEDNDIGASTRSANKPRPDYNEMVADARAGVVTMIIAATSSRLTRRPRENEDLLDLAELYGVTFRYVKSPDYDLNTADGREAARTRAARDTGESERIGERVADARRQRQLAGEFGGGRRPFGYGVVVGVDPITGQDRIDYNKIVSAEAEVIRECVHGVLSDVTLKELARELRQRDVPTVTGTAWSAKTLRDVLLKPRNAGILIYRGEEVGREPSLEIIPEDTYRALVAKLTDPSRVTNAGRAPTWLGTGIYLCVCGSTMEVQSGRARPASYRCARKGGTGDQHVRRNAATIDAFVTGVIAERLARVDLAELVASADTGVDVAAVRAELAMLRQRATDLGLAFAEGDIDRTALAAGTERLNIKIKNLEVELAQVTRVSAVGVLVDAEDVEAAWHQQPLGTQRAILRELVTVTVLPTGRHRGFDSSDVRLDWR